MAAGGGGIDKRSRKTARLFQAEASRGFEMLAFGTDQRVRGRFLRRRRSGGAVINLAHGGRYLSGAGGIRLSRLQGWWPSPRSDVRAYSLPPPLRS
jgi:hypothetical protein